MCSYNQQKLWQHMESEIVGVNENKKILTVGYAEYDLTPGLWAFIMQRHPKLVSGLVVIIKHINLVLHRPRLDLTFLLQR